MSRAKKGARELQQHGSPRKVGDFFRRQPIHDDWEQFIHNKDLARNAVTRDKIMNGEVPGWKLTDKVRIASDFAKSGSGTDADPYIGGPQEAHDDLPDIGGVIFFPSGKYMVDPLDFTVPIDLIGAKTTSVSIQLNPNSNDNLIHINPTIRRPLMQIANLKLEQDRANQTAGYCIRTSGTEVKDFRLINCWLNGGYDGGLYLLNSHNSLIFGNAIEECGGRGIYLQNSNGVISSNLLYNVGIDGVSAIKLDSGGRSTSIVDNTIDIVGLHGIEIMNCRAIIETNELIQCKGKGIYAAPIDGGLKINDNIIQEASYTNSGVYAAIEIYAFYASLSGVQVQGNRIDDVSGNQKYGIYSRLSGARIIDHSSIINNYIADVQTAHIYNDAGMNVHSDISHNVEVQ